MVSYTGTYCIESDLFTDGISGWKWNQRRKNLYYLQAKSESIKQCAGPSESFFDWTKGLQHPMLEIIKTTAKFKLRNTTLSTSAMRQKWRCGTMFGIYTLAKAYVNEMPNFLFIYHKTLVESTVRVYIWLPEPSRDSRSEEDRAITYCPAAWKHRQAGVTQNLSNQRRS